MVQYNSYKVYLVSSTNGWTQGQEVNANEVKFERPTNEFNGSVKNDRHGWEDYSIYAESYGHHTSKITKPNQQTMCK